MIPTLLRLISLVVTAGRLRSDLALENLALRQQLAVLHRQQRRPKLRNRDRFFRLLLSRSWGDWRETLLIVKPETVLRWHRKRFASYWTRLSRQGRPVRPGKDREIRELIRRIAHANILWGAPRVHGELLKLGTDVSERTISRWMLRRRKPPSQTWRAFPDNHVGDLVSIDFLTVPTATFRVLFVLVVLTHDRRRIIHFNGTDHPTADWTSQQLVEAFGDGKLPRFLVRDRDAVYGSTFRERVKALGIEEVVIAPRSPWQTPHVERVIGTLRRECLDHVLFFGESALQSAAGRFLEHKICASYCHITLSGAFRDARILARAQGCLLGQLAGDAIGSRIEFQSAAAIRRSFLDGVRDLADGGTFNTLAGQPTDDSEMALALARSLVREGRFDPDAILEACVRWHRSGPSDIGRTTAATLAGGR